MKRYADIRLLAAVALLVAARRARRRRSGAQATCPAEHSDAAADAEVITVKPPRSRPSTSAWRPSRSAATTPTVVFQTDPNWSRPIARRTALIRLPWRPTHSRPPRSCCPLQHDLDNESRAVSERMPDEPYCSIAIDSLRATTGAVSPTSNVRYILFNKFVKPDRARTRAARTQRLKVLAAPRPSPTTKWRRCSTKHQHLRLLQRRRGAGQSALRLRHRSGQRGDRTRLPVQSAYMTTGNQAARATASPTWRSGPRRRSPATASAQRTTPTGPTPRHTATTGPIPTRR
ncbi:MAG: hypothetical protein ACLRMJ_08415 [Alistipes finegoldii]